MSTVTQIIRPAPPMRPVEVYERVVDEGREWAQTPILGLVSRAFIAGFNIVFGILALGIVHSLVAERFGSSIGDIFGSLAFGLGLEGVANTSAGVDEADAEA